MNSKSYRTNLRKSTLKCTVFKLSFVIRLNLQFQCKDLLVLHLYMSRKFTFIHFSLIADTLKF